MKMSLDRGEEVKKRADEYFNSWYVRGVKSGDIPLEFAGVQGKKLLNDAFHCGCGHVVFELISTMLKAKVGDTQ